MKSLNLSFLKIIFYVAILSPTMAFAQVRYVGNGGGPAELKLLEQYSTLSEWIIGCSQPSGSGLCHVSDKIWHALKNLRALSLNEYVLEFVDQNKLDTLCRDHNVLIPQNDLYMIANDINGEIKPKSDSAILSHTLNGLLSCRPGLATSTLITEKDLSSLSIFPEVKRKNNYITVLSGQNSDLLVSRYPSQDLPSEIAKVINSLELQLMHMESDFALIQSKGKSYRLYFKDNGVKIIFSIKSEVED